LHVGLRRANDEIIDLLLADAPGEWFSRWSIRPHGDGTDGARWVIEHSDSFLLFVDSAALSGPDRRVVANQTELLARRLASSLAGRPVAVVWAKSDAEVPPTIKRDLETALNSALPEGRIFRTSVYPMPDASEPTRSFWNTIEYFLGWEITPVPLPVVAPVVATDPFLAYRG
jgi:hypothetical protein